MERGATFGKNRELFVIVILCADGDCAKDVIHMGNRTFILTFSPNECQSKSFEKMNTLLSAIFKFCTTKNVFNC